MSAAGRLGDRSVVPDDSHGCASCPHKATGPTVTGSRTVLINSRPALRVTDRGIHETCCGSGRWRAQTGAPRVLINDKLAHRVGDKDQHCGGTGSLIQGSPNVLIGDHNGDGSSHWFTMVCRHGTGHKVDGAHVTVTAPDGQKLSEPSNGSTGHHISKIAEKGRATMHVTLKRTRTE